MKLPQLQKKPYLLIIMGLLGFFTGHYIIFGGDAFDFKSRAVFSEIRFKPECPAKDTLCGRVTSLSGDKDGGLTITYWAHGTVLKPELINKDTTLNAEKIRIITRDTLYKYYRDTIKQAVLTEKELEDKYRVNANSDVDFFRNNPVFIIWAVFIIAMFVMWFASFFPLLYLNKEISLHPAFTALELWKNSLKYFIFSIIILLVFHLIIFVSFFDATPFFSSLFIPGW